MYLLIFIARFIVPLALGKWHNFKSWFGFNHFIQQYNENLLFRDNNLKKNLSMFTFSTGRVQDKWTKR